MKIKIWKEAKKMDSDRVVIFSKKIQKDLEEIHNRKVTLFVLWSSAVIAIAFLFYILFLER